MGQPQVAMGRDRTKNVIWQSLPISIYYSKTAFLRKDTGSFLFTGVYKRSSIPSALFDVSQIPELIEIHESSESFMYGGNVTLSRLIESFSNIGLKKFSALGEHLKKVASTPVRNVRLSSTTFFIFAECKEF